MQPSGCHWSTGASFRPLLVAGSPPSTLSATRGVNEVEIRLCWLWGFLVLRPCRGVTSYLSSIPNYIISSRSAAVHDLVNSALLFVGRIFSARLDDTVTLLLLLCPSVIVPRDLPTQLSTHALEQSTAVAYAAKCTASSASA